MRGKVVCEGAVRGGEMVKVVRMGKGLSECYESCASDFLMLFISIAAEITPLN